MQAVFGPPRKGKDLTAGKAVRGQRKFYPVADDRTAPAYGKQDRRVAAPCAVFVLPEALPPVADDRDGLGTEIAYGQCEIAVADLIIHGGSSSAAGSTDDALPWSGADL